MSRPGLLTVLFSGRRPILSEAVAYWKASAYSGSGALQNLKSPGTHDLQLGSTSGADTNDPLWLPYEDAVGKHVYLPGSASNNLSVPRPVASVDYTITYSNDTTVVRTAATANPLIFGDTDVDFAGLKVKEIELRNNAGGAVVGRFLASGASEPFATYVDASGNTWTFNRSASGRKLAVVDRTTFLFGTDDYFEAPASAGLHFSASESFTVGIAMRSAVPAATQRLLTTQASSGSSKGFSLNLLTTSGGRYQFRIADGAVQSSTVQTTATLFGTTIVLTGRRNVATDVIALNVGGFSPAPVTDATTDTLNSGGVLRIGSHTSGGEYADMEFFAAAVIRRALSDDELVRLRQELLS